MWLPGARGRAVSELSHGWLLALIVVIVFLVVRHQARYLLRSKQEGEGWGDFFDRALADSAHDRETRDTLFGTRALTLTVNFVGLVLSLVLVWAYFSSPLVFWLLASYWIVGMAVAPRLIRKSQSFHRAGSSLKLSWRLNIAWIWPIGLVR